MRGASQARVQTMRKKHEQSLLELELGTVEDRTWIVNVLFSVSTTHLGIVFRSDLDICERRTEAVAVYFRCTKA